MILNIQSMFYVVGCHRAGGTSIISTGMPYRFLQDIVSTTNLIVRYFNLTCRASQLNS